MEDIERQKEEQEKSENHNRPHVFQNITEMVVLFSHHDIKAHLLRLLSCVECSYVIGTVAWLTDFNILDVLKQKQGICIVTQKETYNTRASSNDRWKTMIREKYSAMPKFNWEKLYVKEHKTMLQIAPIQFFQKICKEQSIRTAGDRVGKKNDGGILMHEKFILILDANMNFVGTWTGSFNFSKRASQSLENVMYTPDKRVSEVYFQEFLRNLLISEPFR